MYNIGCIFVQVSISVSVVLLDSSTDQLKTVQAFSELNALHKSCHMNVKYTYVVDQENPINSSRYDG